MIELKYNSIKHWIFKERKSVLWENQMPKSRRRRKVGSKKRRARWKVKNKKS